MANKVKIVVDSDGSVLPSSMKTGDIALITFDRGEHTTQHLLRTYKQFVILEDPIHTWNEPPDARMKIKILQPGSIIQITVG
jgi:hypothetical protein